MNKQGPGMIEWTNFTHNAIAGCQHDCEWQMPDGKMANCYAEDTAQGIARAMYPEGFRHHYWRPHLLEEPLGVKKPSRIFEGSMADVFGTWVPEDQIRQVLDMCQRAHWHTFQFLTKNAPRLRKFHFPSNCWVGISAPPSSIKGKPLTPQLQSRWFNIASYALLASDAVTKWVSFEPLSYNIAPDVEQEVADHLDWAVIGAASNGGKYYQPEPEWIANLLDLLDCYNVPVFMKGNLKPSLGKAFSTWREEYPAEQKQLSFL